MVTIPILALVPCSVIHISSSGVPRILPLVLSVCPWSRTFSALSALSALRILSFSYALSLLLRLVPCFLTVPPLLRWASRTLMFSGAEFPAFGYMMPSSYQSILRLAQVVHSSGVPAEVPCDFCQRSQRICIVSSLSRRCAACIYRNSGCSVTTDHSLLEREIALRLELDFILNRLFQCIAQLDSISSASGRF
jgi:hypothetical protein